MGLESEKPAVSVIVCTYNQQDTIAEALDSVLGQETSFRYEIILADDCSRDCTPGICRDYASRYPERIRLFLNNPNKGLVANYYDCIEEAKGEFIADLAGDDRWCDPHKLQRQYDLMKVDKEILLTHSAWKYLLPDGNLADPKGFAMPGSEMVFAPGELLETLLNHRKDLCHVHLCSSMYRRDAVMELMRNNRDLMRSPAWPCEDLQLAVMLARKGKVAWQPQCVLHYRIGHESISSETDFAKNVRFYSGVVRLTRALTLATGNSLELNSGYYLRIMHYLILNAFNSGKKEAFQTVDKLASDNLWPVKLPFGLRSLLAIMAVRPLWRVTRCFWAQGKKLRNQRK